MSEATIQDRPSSIEVSQNAKKAYNFKVKIYFDNEDDDSVVQRTEDIYKELNKRFV